VPGGGEEKKVPGVIKVKKEALNVESIKSYWVEEADEARYPDLKRSFRKKCTKEYAKEQIIIIKETFEWLKKMIL
jgi:hypothetical protein